MSITMAKSSRKSIEFQQKWVVRYGVRVSERDSETSKVNSVECRFCRFFGRDDGCSPGEKRKQTTHIKMFRAPWQSDHIVSHLTDLHTEQVKMYSALTDKQKKVFFNEPSSSLPDLTRNNSDTSITARFFSHPIATDAALNVFVDKSIVEGIIGDLLFDPDPSSIVDDELSDYLEANIRQRIGLSKYHT
jgi:hypothetical protein